MIARRGARGLALGVVALAFQVVAGFAASPSGVLQTFDFSGEGSRKATYGDLTFLIDSVARPDDEKAPRLRAYVGGKPAFTMRLDATTTENASATVKVVTLAKDGPQVVFQHYTYGAHCCTETKIATRHDGAWTIVTGDTLDGDGGYAFQDIDGDGDEELIGSDGSFLYAFSSYAESVAPIRVERLEGTRLIDVSADPRFRSIVARSLKTLESDEAGGARWDSNGFLAGWVATNVLLGQGPTAWMRMLQTYDKDSDWPMPVCMDPVPIDTCRDDRRRNVSFPEALRAHLLSRGYIKNIAAYPLPPKTSGPAK